MKILDLIEIVGDALLVLLLVLCIIAGIVFILERIEGVCVPFIPLEIGIPAIIADACVAAFAIWRKR